MRDASCSRDENTRTRSGYAISWWMARAIGSSSSSMQMSATGRSWSSITRSARRAYPRARAALSRRRSGDVENLEGQAAAFYFVQLFGSGFYRAEERWANAALDYGYQWWLTENAWVALGKGGQYLYIDPARQVVIVRLGKTQGNLGWVDILRQVAETTG